MRLLENELQGSHCVFEFVAFECLRFDCVDASQDLLEAVLKVVDALAVYFLDLGTFVSQLSLIFRGDSVDRLGGLVDHGSHSGLKL